jgi:hypothetical protein
MPSFSGNSSRRGSGRAYTLPDAAKWATSSYSPRTDHRVKSRIVDYIEDEDAEAYLLNNGLLLIPGSNTAWDYLRYNFRLLNVGGNTYKVKNGATGEMYGRVWHQGFLAHAMVIHKKFNSKPPTFIIGHSLGAAAAQVLSMVWGVPAICFAAPRLYAGGMAINNSQKCLCVWRGDDPVGSLPGRRFRHAGKSLRLGESKTFGLLNHHMRHYDAAVTDPNHKSVVPAVWPIT